MVERNQLERLRKDSRELGHYIHKLEQKGKKDVAHRIAKKQSFLESMIADVETRFIRG